MRPRIALKLGVVTSLAESALPVIPKDVPLVREGEGGNLGEEPTIRTVEPLAALELANAEPKAIVEAD